MVNESQPWCAIVSAENAVGIASQPLRTAPPPFQMERILFSRIAILLPLGDISSESAHKAGTLIVELPARDQVLHGDRIVARPERFLLVHAVVLLELRHIDLDAQARFLRHRHLSPDDLERLERQLLALLPDPMCIDRSDVARSGRRAMREHRERNIEMVVRMRTPGKSPLVAKLRDPYRAAQRPGMSIRQR